MKIKSLFPGLCAALLFLPASPDAEATPFYREIFNVCSSDESAAVDAGEQAGWKAFKAAAPVKSGSFLKVNTPGAADALLAYQSAPKGPVSGGAFWTQPVTGLTIFTDEFSFDVSMLESVQYQQRLSGIDSLSGVKDGTKLTLLVGDTWYISDDIARQQGKGVWQTVTWAPRTLTYAKWKNRPGVGPKIPATGGELLPAQGVVSAFGVTIPVVNGRVRIDNYTLIDSQPVERLPENQGSLDQCSVTGVTAGTFCDASAVLPKGQVVLTKKVKNAVLKSVSKRTLAGLRDRAILGLLFESNLRIDQLVNLSRRDYYSVGSLQILNTSGTPRQPIVITAAGKKLVDAYLEKTTIVGSTPLFQQTTKPATVLSGQALCTRQILAIVKKRYSSSGQAVKLRIKK